MKKTIFAGVIATIAFFATTTAVSAKTSKTAALRKTECAVATPAPQNDAFDLSFNSQRQVLNIRQTTGAGSEQVTITNDRGIVLYTGRVSSGNGYINMNGVATGRYNVLLQNGADNTQYKLLIL
jgi:hypothetical protein